ncbi:prenyltransferase/squalene oxidase repeat-containing protein [Streptomyces sp. NPDC001941]|uniref:prenyltransferase/squalene oxidase repeat-containing protein n=1 Tax=Streptomyces sp. NPDC001941 TaxID=3154659 RepID=UPI0033301038
MAAVTPSPTLAARLVAGDEPPSAVFSYDERVITQESLLADAALADLIAQRAPLPPVGPGFTSRFRDPEAGGFHEVLEQYGVVSMAGRHRRTGSQALAYLASISRAELLGDKEDAEQLREEFELLLTRLGEARLATTFLPGLTRPVDRQRRLGDLALALIAVHATGTVHPVTADLTEALFALFDHDKGVFWEAAEPTGEPDLLEGHHLAGNALALLALRRLHDAGHAFGHDTYVAGPLRYLAAHHPHPLSGGFWNRSDHSGRVSVAAELALFKGGASPFPKKDLGDHGLLFGAATAWSAELPEHTDELIRTCLEQAATYSDGSGVFQGQGNWFSTPVDPTVPLARHVMVPPRTPGGFNVGNSAYVLFGSKFAATQLVWEYFDPAGRLRADTAPPVPGDPGRLERLERRPYTPDMSYVATGPIETPRMRVDDYLRWLDSTKVGPAYGLTPYTSPLSFRADNTPQNFSAVHVISDRMALDLPLSDEEADRLTTALFASQNADGGFGEAPGVPSELFTTYCVVLVAYALRRWDFDQERCRAFLRRCQHPHGGFGNFPGYPADSWHTNLAVLALHALGEPAEAHQHAASYVLACRNPDGGYSSVPGGPSESFSTFRAVDTLIPLGFQPPEAERTVAYLRGLQDPSGGFRYGAGRAVSFVGSYHAIAALYLLDAEPADAAACIDWIAGHQSRDGGFSRQFDAPSDTTDEGFIVVQALLMLEKKLNKYWASIMT